MKLFKLSNSNADKIWSKKVRERDGKCLYCGRTTSLNAHHLFGRFHSATRFDLANGFSLCALHHVFSDEWSAHRTEQTFKAWARAHLGEEKYQELERKSKTIIPRRKAIEEFMKSLV